MPHQSQNLDPLRNDRCVFDVEKGRHGIHRLIAVRLFTALSNPVIFVASHYQQALKRSKRVQNLRSLTVR